MNFKSKLMAYSVAATVTAALCSPALSANIKLEYKEYPIDSDIAKSLWSDDIANVTKHGDFDPSILVAKQTIGEDTITYTILSAMSHCGLNECPIKIFKNDDVVAEFSACSNTDFHEINEQANLIMTCSEINSVNLKGM